MSVSPIAGYLTKKEIEEEFNRSHRSLTRDFSQAVRVVEERFAKRWTKRLRLDLLFVFNRGRQIGTIRHTTRRPSAYAIRWHEQANHEVSGSKTRPATRQRYKIQTSNGSENRPAERFKNQTEEKPQENNTNKQQNEPTVVAVENLESFQLLQYAGFDDEISRDLSQKRGLKEIQQQIEWLPYRNPDRNSLGMLRRAIEGNW